MLTQYGFTTTDGQTYLLEIKDGVVLSVVVTNPTEYEVAFISYAGVSIYPDYLPFGFPMWDGAIFHHVSVGDLCSLIPIVCEGFCYKSGMVVKEDGFLYTLVEDEIEDSDKITAIDSKGTYRVMDKKSMRLFSI